MSTFGALSTAYSGLVAAQQALDVAGQNVANAGTDGYTRQRVDQAALGPAGPAGLSSAAGPRVGEGVAVQRIERLGNALLDASVRSTTAAAGYAAQRSAAYQGIESALQEPGSSGVSAQLHSFWAAWHDVANQPGEPAPASVLIDSGKQLAARLSGGYATLAGQWSATRADAATMVTTVNDAARQIAALNVRIRSALAAGGTANELVDARSRLTETVASLAGGTVREQADGTVTVLVGGNALVDGDAARAIGLAGAATMGTSPGPSLVWADRPSVPASLDGGSLAGALSVLAPADGHGTGGPIAEAAAGYNALATSLAAAVNAVHTSGRTTGGATGLAFFALDPSLPPAEGLSVVPADASGVAAAAAGAGAYDGTTADAIAQLGASNGSPDSGWATFVTALGSSSKAAQQGEALSSTAASTAKTAQASSASVSLDEENLGLVAGQHAYQAAARVMSAIDQALDTLINHTGTVGL
ncbi:flagellar hook-associated protein FlgK [Sinomonas sp. ASV322]|uniref:flagellar hook-associated protein FlgK n=1 Tax=Sinomonas sp. ASV322 TaxID=3041920 RepID=UPI0027DBBB5F|nr:flagellar hook-associated protein FlgK [Sinomonas sp. ASV322]MDQ4504517.1 flagellar hook-associated protein FlgK [Sinomonas sp. ASV322]